MPRPKEPRRYCEHCTKERKVKTILVRYQSETRHLDVCRPCAQAIKAAAKLAA